MENNFLGTEFQSFIHLSRYSRFRQEDNRRETWSETVDRYFDFFTKHLKENNNFDLSNDLRNVLTNTILNLEVMPSMRCMMTAGPALERDNIAGYNCSYLAIDRPAAFDEILYILMNGTGVGFSVERQHITKLPVVAEEFHDTDIVIPIADSKMGWAKGLKETIALLYQGSVPTWDTSKVRPAGSILKTFGGRASGPEPLLELFRFVADVFRNAAGRRLTSLECHDIVCKIAEVVVVGGVRRSALISLSNLSDDRMRHAKSGQWWEINPQRALSNNSACYTEKPDIGIFMDEWVSLYKSKSGERGIFNRESAIAQVKKNGRRKSSIGDNEIQFGTNPCCLPGDVVLDTNLGKKTMREVVTLFEENQQLEVLAYNDITKESQYVPIEGALLTRPNAELIELEIEDLSGNIINLRLTPDHLVFTENRGYVRADCLTEDDDLVINPT